MFHLTALSGSGGDVGSGQQPALGTVMSKLSVRKPSPWYFLVPMACATQMQGSPVGKDVSSKTL